MSHKSIAAILSQKDEEEERRQTADDAIEDRITKTRRRLRRQRLTGTRAVRDLTIALEEAEGTVAETDDEISSFEEDVVELLGRRHVPATRQTGNDRRSNDRANDQRSSGQSGAPDRPVSGNTQTSGVQTNNPPSGAPASNGQPPAEPELEGNRRLPSTGNKIWKWLITH